MKFVHFFLSKIHNDFKFSKRSEMFMTYRGYVIKFPKNKYKTLHTMLVEK